MTIDTNICMLIFNAILYVGTFIFYQKRIKYFSIGSIILLLYALVALVGIDLFYHPYSEFEDLTIFPFIYLYTILMIVVYPILKIKDNKITIIQEPSKFLIDTFSVIVIIIAFIASIPLISNFHETIGQIFSGSSFVQNAYSDIRDTVDQRGSGNFDVIGVLSALFVNFAPMLFFYYISRDKINKFITWGLGFTIILNLLLQISQSARGDLVTTSINIAFLFLFFNHSLTEIKKKLFKKIAIFFLISIAIPFAVITVGRFGEKESTGINVTNYFVETYLAQSFLNFNNYGLDAGGYRYGDRTAPLFKQVLGFETANNYNKRIDKYENMKMNESIFSTYVGEFTLDYGAYITLLIFIISSAFFRIRLKQIDKICTFSQYILYYFLFNICVGIFLFPYSDLNGNLRIVLFIILYIVFQRDFKKQQLSLLSVDN